MPWYAVRNLDGDWDGCELIEAADEQSAATIWRQHRELEDDHPVAVFREGECGG